MIWAEARTEYFQYAQRSLGPAAEVCFTLSQRAVHLAAELASAEPASSPLDIAVGLAGIALDCHRTALRDGWSNAPALDISHEVLRVVLIWFHRTRPEERT